MALAAELAAELTSRNREVAPPPLPAVGLRLAVINGTRSSSPPPEVDAAPADAAAEAPADAPSRTPSCEAMETLSCACACRPSSGANPLPRLPRRLLLLLKEVTLPLPKR